MKKIYGRSTHKSNTSKMINRSETVIELPYLKARTPRAKHNKSTYLTQISKQIGDNIEYDDQSSRFISNQQSKLKNILKHMNQDTVNLLSNFTPRPHKNPNHRTAAVLLAVQQKQLSNNEQILQRYQSQINVLVEKVEKLENRDKQFYDKEIYALNQEISESKEVNNEIHRWNEKRGRDIVSNQRAIEEGLFRKIQNDKYLLQHKAQRLRADGQRVNEQIKQYVNKLKEIQSKYTQADTYMKQHEQKNREMADCVAKQKQLLAKKSQLQAYRKKNQFYNVNHQYKYYRLLKNLQALKESLKNYTLAEENLDSKITASKEYISRLQKKFKQIKLQRQLKQKQVNQFLEQSRYHSRTGRLSQFDGSNRNFSRDHVQIQSQEKDGQNKDNAQDKQVEEKEQVANESNENPSRLLEPSNDIQQNPEKKSDDN